MNKRFVILKLVSLLLVLALPAHGTEKKTEDGTVYRIGAGDQITVSVYGEPDLNVEQGRISSGGTVTVPLIGEVSAAGLSADELERRLTSLFADGYLKDPKVSVAVTAYRPVYVHGEVATPGSYSYTEGLTVDKAIALAGGFGRRASKKKIELVRDGDPERRARPVDLGDRVRPGDVITVGASIF